MFFLLLKFTIFIFYVQMTHFILGKGFFEKLNFFSNNLLCNALVCYNYNNW
jgi:hypothetical protein